ncbi:MULTISPECIES: type II toxin-antitoxin system RelE/ParE family toxin [Leptospira]|uniref:type II toxin-antitoxin system RelE/ParE family toxin n=1 Tax=Leptospira TaxID=171 RepID=UPI0005B28BCF|nr:MULTISPECIES: type II toxin-antitoxin system RelE/ParE family toxin [Leptospira]MBF3374574.1 type II toxin-antitoxin system RelE/ParE family toxin [Leptospira borgpetersenii serovar Arborea]AXX14545.1 plasmid maintenance system killer family protein [Leptospira borgpetersenii serovar Ceylonica]MBE8160505.1 type II toxin-antitoxin system RelE/ParE family toxin [Leptospira borgpetersenii serovar Ballum]MBE8166067.1 type II toxin-antitoxin system RelE/ParE family toxin [Leptospira borgpeterseni
MISSFKLSETEKVGNQEFSKKSPNQIQKIAYRKLVMIARSKNIEDLKIPPSNRLEKLSGKRLGQYRINDQWRLCFK